MADIKITDLAAYTVPTSTDVLAVVDVGSNLTKKVSIADMMENAGNGTAAAPGISFDGDNDTGLFLSTSNTIGVATAGTERLNISSTGQFDFKTAGTNSAPTIAFAGDVNTGIYQPAADQVGITAGGTQAFVVAATGVTVPGDLTVQGTTTTIDTTTLVVEDKNIEIGKVGTPTDTTADGGGITLKGATDHTITWVNATNSWDFSEHVNLASGKEFKINGTSVLSGSTLGTGVTTSSLTSVGTISTGTWNGTAIARDYIANDAINGAKIADDSINSEHYVDGSIDTAHIADLQITNGKLAADAVNGGKIADDSINSEHYVDGSIDTAHIADLQITNGKLAADAVNGTKIADDSIDSEHYVDGSIDTAHIADLQVTNGKLAADSVNGAKIADDSIDSEHYVDGSIDTAHIANSQITSAKIADGTIVNADINASAAIAGTKIDADFGDQDLTVDTNRLFVDVSSDSVGINCTPAVTLDINATDAVALPHGTSNQRPTDANAANLTGYIRFNTTTTQFEGHNGSAWASVGGGATGGGSDQWAVEHDNTITASYSVTANKNVISAGPLTINSGAVITVPSSSNWVIV